MSIELPYIEALRRSNKNNTWEDVGRALDILWAEGIDPWDRFNGTTLSMSYEAFERICVLWGNAKRKCDAADQERDIAKRETDDIKRVIDIQDIIISEKERSKNRWKKISVFLIAAILCVSVVSAFVVTAGSSKGGTASNIGNTSTARPTASPAATATPKVSPTAPPTASQTASPSGGKLVPLASVFMVEDTINRDRVAPLTIKTSGSYSHYVLLKLQSDPSSRIGFYIAAGETLETDVPIGVYDIVYATGTDWEGKILLFGEKTSCYSCEDTFSFYYDSSDGSYVGYTLTLYPVSYGNMDTESIPMSDFYGHT